MKLLRSLLFVIWLYGSMAVIGIALLPWVAADDTYVWVGLRTWTRTILWGLRWIVGATVTIEGLENVPQGAALIASKHQAMLDTLVPSLIFKEPVFIFKRELGNTPILGLYLNRNQIPVDRGGYASALKSIVRGAREATAKNRQVLIFPEGTRQDLDAPPDYKSGIAAMYKDLAIPVTPIALSTGLIWKPKGVMRMPGTAVIKVLAPIPPGLSRDEFMKELESRIETESQALLPPDRRRSVKA
jgi:1-acyl-sn-glycerol-3-phosphate acyltransferase